MRHTLAMLCCLLSMGCTTIPATYRKVPKERATECVTHCEALGMKLTGVVIIRDSAGCVCELKDSEMKVSPAAVSAVAGGALIAEDDEAAAPGAKQGGTLGRGR